MKKHLTLTLAAALAAACLLTQCADLAGLPSAPPAPPDPAMLSASKAAPFVNSLGMKFVPVPGTNVLFSTTETTVAQYQAAGMGYLAPGFPQPSDHPAVNVTWNDAKAWCAWLSKRDGLNYRLPTDAEWSAAVGGSGYPWGNSWPPPNDCGNYFGQEAKVPEMESYLQAQLWFQHGGYTKVGVIGGFRDRHVFTAPVGSYPANWLGIHDLGGNVWEWCGDSKIMRGGSWVVNDRRSVGSSESDAHGADFRDSLASGYRIGRDPYWKCLPGYGFRCVVER